jgi:hypothetical protein
MSFSSCWNLKWVFPVASGLGKTVPRLGAKNLRLLFGNFWCLVHSFNMLKVKAVFWFVAKLLVTCWVYVYRHSCCNFLWHLLQALASIMHTWDGFFKKSLSTRFVAYTKLCTTVLYMLRCLCMVLTHNENNCWYYKHKKYNCEFYAAMIGRSRPSGSTSKTKT